jgi:predicted site-specific integrase-resolvase
MASLRLNHRLNSNAAISVNTLPEDEAMKKVKRAGVYCRVSTQEQSTAAQETELKEFANNRGWEVARVYSDTISGTKDSRPGLNQLMTNCRIRKIDVVLVWKFDRFARSASHLLRALETFEELGVEFVSISEQVVRNDWSSCPAGYFVGALLLEKSPAWNKARVSEQTFGPRSIKLHNEPEHVA